jgi:hypothetical protein
MDGRKSAPRREQGKTEKAYLMMTQNHYAARQAEIRRQMVNRLTGGMAPQRNRRSGMAPTTVVDADVMARLAPQIAPAKSLPARQDAAAAIVAAGCKRRNEPLPAIFEAGPAPRREVRITAEMIIASAAKARGEKPKPLIAGPKQIRRVVSAQEIIDAGNAARQPRG